MPRWVRADTRHSAVRLRFVSAVLVAVLSVATPLLAAEDGEGGVAAAAQQFLKTSFWALLAFVVVLWILWKYLFPPIIQALDKRAKTIEDSLLAAQKTKEEAEKMIAQHEASLETARSEGRAIIEEAKEDAIKVKNGIVADARRESGEIVERGRRELELAKKAAVDDLYRQSTALSFELAEKVIQKTLKPKDHEKLIDSCIKSYREKV